MTYVPVPYTKRRRPKRRERPNSADDHSLTLLVSPTVMGALDRLRDTGLYGNGVDVESVAEELLRMALRAAWEGE